MKLSTNRLIIRPFTLQDAPSVYAYMKRPEVVVPACLPQLDSLEGAKEALQKWIAEDKRYAIALKEDQQAIGHISIKEDSEEGRADTRELGFALNPDYQHKGYMTEAVLAVKAYLFVCGIRYIWACCFADNLPSHQLINRCGFVYRNTGILFSEALQMEKPSYECCAENLRFHKSEEREWE